MKKKKEGKLIHSNALKRTLIVTLIVCLIVIAIATYVQLTGQSKLTEKCSYLDPITIDLLAFTAALFLFVEGIIRIIEHSSASLKRQLTRIIRVAFGTAIMTLHIIQFIHK